MVRDAYMSRAPAAERVARHFDGSFVVLVDVDVEVQRRYHE